MNTNTRTIHTGLYGDQAREALDSVHGQLSDGMWENSRGYDRYWLNVDVDRADDGEVVFKVNTDNYVLWAKKYIENPFVSMDEKQFKDWYARKLKAVITQEFKDNQTYRQWYRRNTEYNSRYLGHDPNYGTVVNVADIYCLYDALLGRPVGIDKYEVSTICRVFGNKKTNAAEIAQAKSLREKREAINAKYDAIFKACREENERREKELEQSFNQKLEKIEDDKKAELAAIGIVA